MLTLAHNFSSQHIFKADSLSEAKRLKNDLYNSDYNHLGMAFAPLACNSFGQQDPDFLGYLIFYDYSDIQTASQNLFCQSTQEVLVTILECVCLQVLGGHLKRNRNLNTLPFPSAF
jgi:hypothetical protein